MEENLSDALHLGVTVFIFVAAISTSLMLMQSISKMSELSLETLDTMDKTVIERSYIPAAYVVTGAEVISYYSNYVIPGNTSFEFYIDTANTLTETDASIGLGEDYKPPIDPTPFIGRCVKLVNTDATQFTTLKAKLNSFFVKVVRPNGNKTNVYFISAGNDRERAESFMYCLAQLD